MQTRIEEEENEVPGVSLSNACTHPWAMVVVHFNTKATCRAVKGPWWSHDLACSTVGQGLTLILNDCFGCFPASVRYHFGEALIGHKFKLVD